MARSDGRVDAEPDAELRNRPAVGFVARAGDADAVAGAILRARRHDHQTIVLADPEANADSVAFARELDALVVETDRSPGVDPRRQLVRAAREYGFPGLIVLDRPGDRVDYDRSWSTLEAADSFAVTAEPTPEVRSGPAVLVAIPAYEESGTIGEVVRQALNYADEVVVVDDGSADGTAAAADEAGATVLAHDRNRGYGAALKTAFREAERCGADRLVTIDADAQHDPADIPRLVEGLGDDDARVVVGSRFAPESETDLPAYRRFGIKVVNLLTNLSLGAVRREARVGDTQSGFRAYGREAIVSLAADETIGDGMGASTDILQHVRQHGYEINEVGATVEYAVENGSHHNPVSHGISLVMNLLRTIELQRPVTVVGIPGFASTLLGIGLGYWVFVLYIQRGTFPLGLAVTASFFALAGILACFTAIILHALTQHLK